ncbi:MAG TPA: UDP-N-acetylmuramoyl-L-alanyl-D-glutamate--2,6-diaminopimelate ligase [Firmicutes bacterium]|nr:UDP-N-acetylmuramoyl-L-alanyl-D-glutamate--2,6-diaminopimelate ligase [Bacillota bacterium]
MKLSALLAGYDTNNRQYPDVTVAGITHDSRFVRPGDLFVCLEGLRVDGHLFAGQAVEKGAVAVVATKQLYLPVPVIVVRDSRHALSYFADRFFASPSKKLHVAGVTGTNGKTTTTHFLQSIYRAAGRPCAVIGTVGILIDKEYLAGGMTTPEAYDLHRTFATLREKNIGTVAMEVSSHSLAWRRVEHVAFDTAVFTNLSHEHLDFHKTMEEYFRAKARLFQLVTEANRPQAVINSDDPYGRRLSSQTSLQVLTYGLQEGADVRGYIAAATVKSTLLAVRYQKYDFELNVHLPGEFNAYNALAAAAAALAEGISPEVIALGIDAVEAVPGRLEAVNYQQEYSIFIDFAHTPDGLEKVLKTLSAIPHRRLITVFGCPGDRDRAKRPVMGRIAELYSDLVVVTSDNPATESPHAIIGEILRGMETKPVVLPDRGEAVRYALSVAGKGDIVLLAGKGHENYQLIGDKHVPYSDRRAVETFFIS